MGKTSAARILAKALNCLNPVNSNPCNVCEHCMEITTGASMDVIEIDGASNRGIDEIRQLREAVRFIPVKYPYKVYIIDEVHMLTEQASNALLKTLEEPPSYVVFIFATTDAHKVISTFLSRCQRYDFKKINFDDMKDNLKRIFSSEQINYDVSTLNLIIRQSDGCMRDALSLSDQVISYTSGNLNYDTVAELLGVGADPIITSLYAAALEERPEEIEALIQTLTDRAVSLAYATERMLTHTRNLLFLINGAVQIKKELTADENEFYKKLLTTVSQERLFALFQLLQKLHTDLKYSTFPRYTFEFGLFKAASLSRLIPLPAGKAQVVGNIQAVSNTKVISNIQTQSYKTETKAIQVEAVVPEPKATLSPKEKEWHSILAALRNEVPGLAAALAHGTIEECTPEKVHISFPKERHFQFTRSIRQENINLFTDFLVRKLGAAVKLEITGGDDEKKKGLAEKKSELEIIYETQLRQETAELPPIKELLRLLNLPSDKIKIIKNS